MQRTTLSLLAWFIGYFILGLVGVGVGSASAWPINPDTELIVLPKNQNQHPPSLKKRGWIRNTLPQKNHRNYEEHKSLGEVMADTARMSIPAMKGVPNLIKVKGRKAYTRIQDKIRSYPQGIHQSTRSAVKKNAKLAWQNLRRPDLWHKEIKAELKTFKPGRLWHRRAKINISIAKKQDYNRRALKWESREPPAYRAQDIYQ